MKALLQSLSDGPSELAPVLAMAFLTITDSPRTRAYLHPGTDLEMGLSGITDAYGRGEVHMEHMKASARVIITMLRSWSGEYIPNILDLISCAAGLMYLCMDDMLAIRTLVDTLRVPSLELRVSSLALFHTYVH
jgi:rapamycin-insensitive companion of mTOR